MEGEEISPTRRRLPSSNVNARSDPRPIPDAGFYYAPFHAGQACKPGLILQRSLYSRALIIGLL
jgi:hypothetical protein